MTEKNDHTHRQRRKQTVDEGLALQGHVRDSGPLLVGYGATRAADRFVTDSANRTRASETEHVLGRNARHFDEVRCVSILQADQVGEQLLVSRIDDRGVVVEARVADRLRTDIRASRQQEHRENSRDADLAAAESGSQSLLHAAAKIPHSDRVSQNGDVERQATGKSTKTRMSQSR